MPGLASTIAWRSDDHSQKEIRRGERMNLLAASIVTLALTSQAAAQTNDNMSEPAKSSAMQTSDLQIVSPALDKYTKAALLGDLWKRPQLSPRDRSIVTLAVLLTPNQTHEIHF